MGFGREGKSTYHFLKTYANPNFIAISDSIELEVEEKFYLKEEYINDISSFDISEIRPVGCFRVGVNLARKNI